MGTQCGRLGVLAAACAAAWSLGAGSASAQVYVSDTYRVSHALYAKYGGFNPYGPMSEVLPGEPYGPVPRRPVYAWQPLQPNHYHRMVDMDEAANWPGDFPSDYSGEAWWIADPSYIEDDIPDDWYPFCGRFPYQRIDPQPLPLYPSLYP